MSISPFGTTSTFLASPSKLQLAKGCLLAATVVVAAVLVVAVAVAVLRGGAVLVVAVNCSACLRVSFQ